MVATGYQTPDVMTANIMKDFSVESSVKRCLVVCLFRKTHGSSVLVFPLHYICCLIIATPVLRRSEMTRNSSLQDMK